MLAGLPWGLGRLAGPPLPGHWPGWQQVRESLASPLSGGTAITVLAGAAWLLWAVFAAAVIAEVTAAACGRPVPRLPAIAPVQTLAYRAAGASGTSGPARAQARVHTVAAGDTLWELARAYLGSGDRWHQIYALNRDRPQPGGGTLTDPARIYPGCDLLIPAASPPHRRGNPPGTGHPAPAPPHPGTGRQRVTRPGP